MTTSNPFLKKIASLSETPTPEPDKKEEGETAPVGKYQPRLTDVAKDQSATLSNLWRDKANPMLSDIATRT